jgi:hypothetical protein
LRAAGDNGEPSAQIDLVQGVSPDCCFVILRGSR